MCFGWIAPVLQPEAARFPLYHRFPIRDKSCSNPKMFPPWPPVWCGARCHWEHADHARLELVATMLEGESSRLNRHLVVDERCAVAVMAMQFGLRNGGGFGAPPYFLPLAWNSREEGFLPGLGITRSPRAPAKELQKTDPVLSNDRLMRRPFVGGTRSKNDRSSTALTLDPKSLNNQRLRVLMKFSAPSNT